MATVTVPSSSSGLPAITYTYNSSATQTVAQQIATALWAAARGSTLAVTSVSGAGTAPAAGLTGTQELVSTANGVVSVPAGYSVVANESTGAATINAAAGTTIFTGDFGGAFSVGGNSTILGGAGVASLTAGGNGDQIYANGADSVMFGAGATADNDTIFAGAGSAVTIYGANGSIDWIGNGAAQSFIGGSNTSPSAPPTINLTTGGSDTVGAAGGVFQVSGSGVVSTSSSTGTATIYGSSGAAVSLVGSGGTGTSGNGNPQFLVAGAGNETLNASGSTGAVWLSVNTTVPGASAGTVTETAGSGNDVLNAGAAPGSVIMNGGSGNDIFAFWKQAASATPAADVVNNFNANNDVVYILGYGGGGSASQLQAAAGVSTGGNVTLTLNDNTTITFTNLGNASALNGKILYT